VAAVAAQEELGLLDAGRKLVPPRLDAQARRERRAVGGRAEALGRDDAGRRGERGREQAVEEDVPEDAGS